MPLLFNYTDDADTSNEHVVHITQAPHLTTLQFNSNGPFNFFKDLKDTSIEETLEFFVRHCQKLGLATVTLQVTSVWEPKEFVLALGKVLTSTDWDKHPTQTLTLVCSGPLLAAVNGYFQGSWYL